jgi:F-type H+-transporting ATPase subunit alpha
LKQGLNDPYTVEDQVAISMLVLKLIENVPVNKVREFEKIS